MKIDIAAWLTRQLRIGHDNLESMSAFGDGHRALTDELLDRSRERTRAIVNLLARARKLAVHYGQQLAGRAFALALANGTFDAASVPHFDEIADTLAREYPELFAGQDDVGNRLAELIQEGPPASLTWVEARRQALEILMDGDY